jgi:hypothetical protein
MHVLDIHSRIVAGSTTRVFAELEAMGTANDRIWPASSIPFIRTPGPMRVGETQESHGIIHATLEAYEPGRKLSWRATVPFLRGTHGFTTEALDDSTTRVVHTLDANVTLWFAPIWRWKIARIHTRIIESLFDHLEQAARA